MYSSLLGPPRYTDPPSTSSYLTTSLLEPQAPQIRWGTPMPEELEYRYKRRRSGGDRRHGERRVRDIPVAIECRMGGDRRSGLERRSGLDRRTMRRDTSAAPRTPRRLRSTVQNILKKETQDAEKSPTLPQ